MKVNVLILLADLNQSDFSSSLSTNPLSGVTDRRFSVGTQGATSHISKAARPRNQDLENEDRQTKAIRAYLISSGATPRKCGFAAPIGCARGKVRPSANRSSGVIGILLLPNSQFSPSLHSNSQHPCPAFPPQCLYLTAITFLKHSF